MVVQHFFPVVYILYRNAFQNYDYYFKKMLHILCLIYIKISMYNNLINIIITQQISILRTI